MLLRRACPSARRSQRQLFEAIAQLDEGEVYGRCIQLAVELLEHLGRGHVDVGDRLALQDDPVGLALDARGRLISSRNLPELAKNSGASQR